MTGMPRRGMHYHSGRFIDDDHIIILINDIQGNVFWFQINGLRFFRYDAHHITHLKLVLGFNGLPINGDVTILNPFLQLRAGNIT